MSKEISLENRFPLFLNLLFQLEGGYSDQVLDHGGKTKWGISQSFLKFYDPNIKIQDLTKEMAFRIYQNYYYNQVKPSKITMNHYHYFDIAVNSGIGTYKVCLLTTKDNTKAILAWRIKEYNDIVAHDPTQKIFLNGWLNRIERINKYFEY